MAYVWSPDVQVTVLVPESFRDNNGEHAVLPSCQKMRGLSLIRRVWLDFVVRADRNIGFFFVLPD
jgi:hypothetical protein